MHGTVPQQLLPHAPDEYFRHEQNSQNLSRGKEKPDPNTFFEPVAKALQSATQLLIFGTGTGKSSEMVQFVMWLNRHHPDLAHRIIGTVVVDEHHLTESQLLAKAREFYATPRKPAHV
jgi:Rad3-related DNA helicase